MRLADFCEDRPARTGGSDANLRTRMRKPNPVYRRAVTVIAGCAVVSAISHAQFHQHNLVSDGSVGADVVDSDLKNPWGMASTGSSPLWVANQGSSSSTLYNGSGAKQSLVVSMGIEPTGVVFNSSATDFKIFGQSAASFIFSSRDGSFAAWNASQGTSAVKITQAFGRDYTGIGIKSNRLYAADFAGGGLDVYDGEFKFVSSGTDPSAPSGFAPHGVRVFGNDVFVAYAKPGSAGGFVDRFDLNGGFLARVVTDNARLSGAYGMEFAPSSWGSLAGSLLVASEDTGKINAYDVTTGAFLATLQENGQDITNVGLHSITLGNGGSGGDPETLYLTAGLGGEQHGLLATLNVVPEPGLMLSFASGLLLVGKRRKQARKKTG